MAYAHSNQGHIWGIVKCLTFGQIDCISCVLLLAILFTLFAVGATWFIFTLQPKLGRYFFCWLDRIFLGRWYITHYWNKWKKDQKKKAKDNCKKQKCIKKCIKKCDSESSSSSSSSSESSESESECSTSSSSSESSESEEEKQVKREKFAHQKLLLHCPTFTPGTPITTPGSTTYTWCVPECIYSITVTMIGGGGAGGNLVIAEPLVLNGNGGQAGTAFIDTPLLVTPGEQITITVGGGGVPSTIATTGGAIATTFSALKSKAKSLGLKAVSAVGARLASPAERGVPSTVATVRRTLVAEGGQSGNDACIDDHSVEYGFNSGGFAGQCGEPGSTNPVSGPQPPVRPGKVFGQGGNSAFARGGIPLTGSAATSFSAPGIERISRSADRVSASPSALLDSNSNGSRYHNNNNNATFEEIDPSCICDIPCRVNLFEPDPNGSLGSGGAGQTLSSPPGRGGDGFVIIRW